MKVSRSRCIELPKEDALGGTEDEFSLADGECPGVANDGGFHVAGGVLRGVDLMLEIDSRRNQSPNLVVDVFEPQRIPMRCDRNGSSGVRYGNDKEAFCDAAASHSGADRHGDVEEPVAIGREIK